MPRYVDADKLRKTMSDAYWDENIHSAKDDPCVIDAMIDWSIRQVKDAPTEDVAPVIHAHWIITYESTAGVTDAKCSNCGFASLAYENDVHTDNDCHYCPSCGAKMDEVVE